MLVFPQLSTGASGQFPLTRQRRVRTVVNSLGDGRVVRYADEFGEAAWDLDLRELSSAERAAVESLFAATEGRLRAFTFLDPADNLLAHSEALSNAVWTKDALVAVTAAVVDPLGTSRASRVVNGGLANQGLSQALAAPDTFVYCWSAWVKGSGLVTLSAGSLTRTFAASGTWTRISVAGAPDGQGASVSFRLTVDPGGSVDVFGLQVEAQPGASGYKITGSQGGVYARARFAKDDLRISAEGPENERARVRIVAMTGN